MKTIKATSAVMLLTAALGCQQQSAQDKKLAELEQQLKDTQAQLAATKPPEPAANAPVEAVPSGAPSENAPDPAAAAASTSASGAKSLAASPAKPSSAPAKKTSATANATPPPPPGVSADQYAADKSTARDIVDKQQSVNANQASTNAQLQQQIEDLKPIEVTLPTGTVIPARTTKELSTANLQNGATFDTLLDRDLVVDGTTVAKKGARVTGIVVTSDPGGKVKGVASLSVAARSLVGTKGTVISLRTDSYETVADSTKKKDVARTGIATGAGALIGAIAGGGKGAAIGAGIGAGAGVGTAMATRGDAATIPAETLIEFRLTTPVTATIPR